MAQSNPKIQVIYNPKANRGRNARLAEDLHQLANRQAGANWVHTDYPGHATELAAQAAQQGYERVISVGGDGTLREVMNGLMQADPTVRPALGIVPVGSGNDFVRGVETGLAPKNLSPAQALEHAFDGAHMQTIDIGFLSLNGGLRRYWANVLGIGFDAAVTLHSHQMKHLHGPMMYFIAAILTIIENYDAPAFQINIDGEQWSQHIQMLTVGNGTREGGGFITTPQSIVDDGLLDYAMFKPVSRAMMIRLIPEVMRGTHGRFSQVRMGTFQLMHLSADRPLIIHSDGDMLATTPDNVRSIDIGVMPAALRLVN